MVFITPYTNDFRYDFILYLISFWGMLYKLDVIINGSHLFYIEFLSPSIQFSGYIYANVYLIFITEAMYFLKIQILSLNLSYHIWPVIFRKPYLQIIYLGKALIIEAKGNNLSLNNDFKRNVIGIKILDLHSYSFLSQYIMKSVKQIMILRFALKSNVKELKYIHFQVEESYNRLHLEIFQESIWFLIFLI